METHLSNDDALIAKHLGAQYVGKRFLRYHELKALGICGNRTAVNLWMRRGQFPRSIKIAGPYGKRLVWATIEVVQMIERRLGERDGAQFPDEKNEEPGADGCNAAPGPEGLQTPCHVEQEAE
jgi:predicted DNA-binding transcriptional regulator AlpA